MGQVALVRSGSNRRRTTKLRRSDTAVKMLLTARCQQPTPTMPVPSFCPPELDTDDTKFQARDIEPIHGWASISMLGSVLPQRGSSDAQSPHRSYRYSLSSRRRHPFRRAQDDKQRSTRIRRKHCHRYPEPHQTSQRPARSKLSRSLTEPLSLLSGCQQSLATAFQLLPLQRQPQRLLSQRSQTFGFMRGPTWNCLKFDTSWRSARS
jgi:hypothetical protein